MTLIPSEDEYVRYIDDGHLVTCNGTDGETAKWLAPDNVVVESDDRVRVENDFGQLRLIIKKVKKEDQGKWTCIVGGDFSEEKSFMLNVFAAIEFEPINDVITINEGEDATLRCEASGAPEPSLHWYYNGRSLMETITSELQL